MDRIKIPYTPSTGHVYQQFDQLVRSAPQLPIKPLLNGLKAVILVVNNSCTQSTVLKTDTLFSQANYESGIGLSHEFTKWEFVRELKISYQLRKSYLHSRSKKRYEFS